MKEKFESKEITLNKLVENTGQIEGLPQNPRFISESKFNDLKESIKENGDMLYLRELIAVDMEDGTFVVIAGNMRLKAMRAVGMKSAPVKILPKNTPAEKLQAYTILDNNEFGQWDWDMLANEWDIENLKRWGIDSWGDGIDSDGVEEHEVTQAEEDEGISDEEEAQLPATVKYGEVWQLGEHRLMCGDSTKAEDVEKLIGGDLADLLLTDPPYNVNYEGETGLKIDNDNMSDSNFHAFLVSAFENARNAMKDGASFYIWHADSEGFNFRGACKEVGFKVRQCLIWNKNSMVLGRQDYQWKHEPCLYGWKDGASHNWYNDRKQTTVLDFNRPTVSKEHPTMKPVALFGYQMQNSSKEGDIVLDLFGGSGTTVIAAEQLGRRGYVMEFSPHYCDVIIARWEKLTGKKAEKL